MAILSKARRSKLKKLTICRLAPKLNQHHHHHRSSSPTLSQAEHIDVAAAAASSSATTSNSASTSKSKPSKKHKKSSFSGHQLGVINENFLIGKMSSNETPADAAAASPSSSDASKLTTTMPGAMAATISPHNSTTSPLLPSRSFSVRSNLSDLSVSHGEIDAYMESFLENARFGNYDQVNEAITRFNSLHADQSIDMVKTNFDINYRGDIFILFYSFVLFFIFLLILSQNLPFYIIVFKMCLKWVGRTRRSNRLVQIQQLAESINPSGDQSNTRVSD